MPLVTSQKPMIYANKPEYFRENSYKTSSSQLEPLTTQITHSVSEQMESQTSIVAKNLMSEALLHSAKSLDIPHFSSITQEGTQRVFLNPSTLEQIQTIQAHLRNDATVLELCFTGRYSPHARAILGEHHTHVEKSDSRRSESWQLLNWGPIRPTSGRVFTALIQLTAEESSKYNTELKKGFEIQEQGSPGTPGLLASVYQRYFDCASFFTALPIGDNSEPLWQLIGLDGAYRNDLRGLMEALVVNTNNRVIGICTYGQKQENFGCEDDLKRFLF